METKELKNLKIWDGKEFTNLNTVQRHVDEDVVTIQTESGFSLTCKNTHPSWAKFCPEDEEEVVVEAKDLLRMFVLTRNGYEEVIKVLPGKNKEFLYDVSTDTKAFEANNIRTHNSFHCFKNNSIVFVKRNGVLLTTTMEEIFNLVDAPIQITEGKEYKPVNPEEWKIWDCGWVDLLQVTRHQQTEPFLFVSDSKLALIALGTHKIAVHKNLSRCVFCNHASLKQRRHKGKVVEGKVECCNCHKTQSNTPNSFEVTHSLKEIKDVELGDFNSFDISPVNKTKVKDLKYSGYAVASFLAEGSVAYRKTFPRSKKLREEPKPSFVDFSQFNKHVRDQIFEELSKVTAPRKSDKGVTINTIEEVLWWAGLSPRYSSNKKLPSDFLGYSDEWLWDFLAGYLDCDGYLGKSRHGYQYLRFSSVSWAMTQQLLLIANKLGLSASISSRSIPKAHTLNGQEIKGNYPTFVVVVTVSKEAINNLHKSIKIKDLIKPSPAKFVAEIKGNRKFKIIKPIEYKNDYVYDFTTSTGTMIVSGFRVSNSGGVAASRGGGSVSKLERLQQLLNLPKNLPGSAVLSKLTGTIQSIEKDESVGGHNVLVSSGAKISKHYVPEYNELLIKPGDSIDKGDRLSSGPINPHHLLALKNMDAVRTYLSDEMGQMYKEVGGVRRRNVEVVVRNLTNNTEIVDPGASDHLSGDLANISKVEDFNRAQKNPDHKIIHKPILKGIKEAALIKDEDWLNRMNFQRIQNTLIEGAGKAWKAKTTDSISPIGPFAASTIGKHIPGKAEY